jgi:hypothetical protein
MQQRMRSNRGTAIVHMVAVVVRTVVSDGHAIITRYRDDDDLREGQIEDASDSSSEGIPEGRLVCLRGRHADKGLLC